VSGFVPQAWQVIRMPDARGLPGRLYVITVIGFCLWFTHGLCLASGR